MLQNLNDLDNKPYDNCGFDSVNIMILKFSLYPLLWDLTVSRYHSNIILNHFKPVIINHFTFCNSNKCSSFETEIEAHDLS